MRGRKLHERQLEGVRIKITRLSIEAERERESERTGIVSADVIIVHRGVDEKEAHGSGETSAPERIEKKVKKRMERGCVHSRAARRDG